MKTILFRSIHFTIFLSLFFSLLVFDRVYTGSAQTSLTWSEPVNLSNSGSSVDPKLVIDVKGIMHVIWVDKFDGYKYAQSSDGLTWTSPKIVDYPFLPKDDSGPTLVTSAKGTIYIFWRNKSNALYYVQAQPDSLGNPGAWDSAIKLADSVLKFDVVVDSQSALHLGYVKNTGTEESPAGIYYRRLDGFGWSATKNLYVSQYFRSLTPENSHVRLSVTPGDSKLSRVYVVWDDRPQKRIFMANSPDSGANWNEPLQLKGPEDFSGSDMPFNVNINASGDNALLLWQAGEPGTRCAQYSQWSTDGGIQFTEPIKMLDEFTSCPTESNFIAHDGNFPVAILNIQNDLSLIAWDGAEWSDLQPQLELSVFLNPVTFDSVLLGCQDVVFFNASLYVAGCDTGNGGDIWFRSRSLGDFEEWFPSPSAWTSPVAITSGRQNLSSLVSVADNKNVLHSLWVEAPLLDSEWEYTTIQYARWNGGKWSNPSSILSRFAGVPAQLSLTSDVQGRLFLSWNEGRNGDLYFSWASADRANVASEWSVPQQIPTPSEISSSPDILVDDMGRMVVVYSVPINEDRGIYVVRSDDLGKTWSQPLRVFDAVSANWDLADQPKIGLSGDGRLHLLFTRISLREADRSGGLYYLRSLDGGNTWSQPELVSEQPIPWNQIVGFDKQMVHRLWQEDDGITLDTFHQFSLDGGETWENPVKVFSSSNTSAKVTLTNASTGDLYAMQMYTENESLKIEVLKWDGFRWVSQEGRTVNVENDTAQFSAVTDVTPQGILGITISVTYPDLIAGLKNEIIHFSRSLELSGENQPTAPLLIATSSAANLTDASGTQLTPTSSSPLANLGDAPSSSRRNLIGLLLVGGVMVLIIIIIWPRKRING